MQHLFAAPTGFALGKVKETQDPHSRGRVQVTLVALGVDVWAACVVPSAANGYGVALLPKKDEMVLVAFLTPDQAFVLGSVWAGDSSQPSEAAPVEQRYVIKTPKGTTMLFDDDGPSLSVTTPQSNSLTLTDAGGGSCKVQIGGTSIDAESDSVTVTTGSSIQLQTSTLTITAPSVTVDAAMAQFSGVIQCDTLIATTVVGTSYTPGAGNIW